MDKEKEKKMSNNDITLNIPDMTVAEVIDSLSMLYTGALQSGRDLKDYYTPFLWGAAGVGKSNSVYQLAKRLQDSTGRRVVVTDVRLLLFSPVDLRGVPMADAERRFTNWLRPKIFDMDGGADALNILFLDELSAAPQSVQAAAYQICLDRKIGEHTLPDNCIVIAAGNRLTDQSVSYKMPKALCNRLMHFNVISDYGAWKKWAIQNGISEKVIAYLGIDNSRLCAEPTSSDLAFCTPRSWAAVSALLKTVNDNPSEIHSLIAACIGNDTAVEFEAFCNGILKMPNVEDIINGKCKELPKTHDVMYALIAALTAKLGSMGDSLTDEQLENVCLYAERFPKDFAYVFMKDISALKGFDQRLMKCHEFQKWLNKMHFSS